MAFDLSYDMGDRLITEAPLAPELCSGPLNFFTGCTIIQKEARKSNLRQADVSLDDSYEIAQQQRKR